MAATRVAPFAGIIRSRFDGSVAHPRYALSLSSRLGPVGSPC